MERTAHSARRAGGTHEAFSARHEAICSNNATDRQPKNSGPDLSP